MIDNWKFACRQIALVVASSAALTIAPTSVCPSGNRADAQIIPDNTLGSERSIVRPNQAIRGLPAALIEGGARRGVNLFQSFADFNVGEGQRVYFANPADVQNILSRVTGSNPSQILGTLGVDGTANLFLLNPRGILFGPNARLDIAGSFVASTAAKLMFENGLEFSAIDPQAPPLLALNLRPGLQYGTDYRGDITNSGHLLVGAGQTLSLAGNAVTTSGSLTAPGGAVQVLGDRVSLLNNARIDVSSLSGGGTVLIGGDFQGKGQVPNASQTVVDRTVFINADALGDGNGGKVVVWANHTTRFDGTISAKGGANSGNGGAVEVSGKQFLHFNGDVNTSATRGSIGTLLLDPFDLTIDQPFTSAAATTFQADNNITFNAPVTITTVGAGVTAVAGNNIFVNSNIFTFGGSVVLTAQQGNVSINGATIDTTSLSDVFAGSVVIAAGNQVLLSNSSLNAKSENSSLDTDLATRVTIAGRSVRIDRSYISTTNFGSGYAGDVAITAQNQVEILNSFAADQSLGIFSQGNFGRILIGQSDYFQTSPAIVSIDRSQLITNNSTAVGSDKIDAGGIAIRANDTVSLSTGTTLRSSTSRLGDAGTIIIQTPGTVSLSGGTSIATDAKGTAQGNAGGVLIQAGSLRLTEASSISTSTYAQNSTAGNFSGIPGTVSGSVAGAVILVADDNITLDNSTIFNNLENGAQGQAGFILVAADSLSLFHGGQIQTLVRGTDKNGPAASGTAGDIFIAVDETIRLSGRNEGGFPSAIFSDVGVGATGTGGTVFIRGNNNARARSVQLRDGGLISVNNFGTKQSDTAGNVLVFTRGIWLDNGSSILAISKSGQGGNIFLNTDALILGRNSDIATTAGFDGTVGSGGNIAIGTGTLTLGIGRRPDGQFIESSAFADITLLVAGKTFRDNNILAEAFNGTGGNIRINASRLQDIAERPDLLIRNDISTESSRGINGTTVVNTLDVFPSVRTNPLPDRYEIPTVSEGCDPRVRQETTRFIATGRGGIAANPNDILSQETLVDSSASPATPSSAIPPDRIASTAIVPARGWLRAADGSIRFTAYPTDATVPVIPYPLWTPPTTCHGR